MNARKPVTILVTGVGDTVGQALVKAARMSTVACRVVGTDRDPLAVGLRWVDVARLLPHSSRADEYLAALREVVAAEGVRLVLPGSEKELDLLSRHAQDFTAETGAQVVASPPEVLGISLDKWETCRFLERAGVNFPRFARLDDREAVRELVEALGFPLIAKPVHGTGARGVVTVRSWRDLEAAGAGGVDTVVEELLEPEDEEYSVAVYTARDGRAAGTISYRREQLVAGDTFRARVRPNPVAETEAEAVVAALGAAGPCNVQLRVTPRGPVTFEINARFSGGAAMRAHFGYNEVEMAIRDLVLGEAIGQPPTSGGMALRFWDELYVDDDAEEASGDPRRGAAAAGTPAGAAGDVDPARGVGVA